MSSRAERPDFFRRADLWRVAPYPTLSSRPERPDFCLRAAFWRVGPRSGGISFGSLLCDLCVSFLFHPGRLLPARRRREAGRSWFRLVSLFLRGVLVEVEHRSTSSRQDLSLAVIPTPKLSSRPKARAVCGLAHSVIPTGGPRCLRAVVEGSRQHVSQPLLPTFLVLTY